MNSGLESADKRQERNQLFAKVFEIDVAGVYEITVMFHWSGTGFANTAKIKVYTAEGGGAHAVRLQTNSNYTVAGKRQNATLTTIRTLAVDDKAKATIDGFFSTTVLQGSYFMVRRVG